MSKLPIPNAAGSYVFPDGSKIVKQHHSWAAYWSNGVPLRGDNDERSYFQTPKDAARCLDEAGEGPTSMQERFKGVTRERHEIDKLIADWKADPCWDLEDAEGFEAHKDELRRVRFVEMDRQQQAERWALEEKARAIGCSGNHMLAAYVLALEARVATLEQRLEKVEA